MNDAYLYQSSANDLKIHDTIVILFVFQKFFSCSPILIFM